MADIVAMLAAVAGAAGGAEPDPYFNYTTLLLPGNGTNGAQNNTFLDSSTNNFTITRYGNTTQGTFSPFSQTGWSNYFDGSGDYLTIADNTALDPGTGDFTIECWAYQTTSTGDQGLISKDYSTGFHLQIASGVPRFWIAGSSIQSSTSLSLNTWTHIACVRSGTTAKIYLNGTEVASGTLSGNASSSTSVFIGRSSHNTSEYFYGYVSNARIVKGTAVYTGAFTPPIEPLTAISGTSLLTCQSNRFIDNSTNNFSITVNGNTSVQAFSPFAPTAAYSAATNGGSGYFDGTGDYLSLTISSALYLSANFTVECWVYYSSLSAESWVISNYAFTSPYFGIAIDTNGTVGVYLNAGSRDPISGSGAAVPNAWNHIAVVRSGTTVTLYVNGTARDTKLSDSNNYFSGGGSLYVGGGAQTLSAFTGYISDARIVNGTAVYTTNFTPPSAPLTAITDTDLLLSYTNAGITDATAKNDLETVGNAQISSTTAKFGTTSIKFDGTGDYLAIPYSPNIKLPSGDWTIEFWMYCTGAQAGSSNVIWTQDDTGGYSGIIVGANSSRQVQFSSSTSGSSWNYLFQTIGTYTDNTWAHVAICKSGSTVYGFFNGSLNLTINSFPATVYSTTDQSTLGRYSAYYFNGYIDDFRITKGVARYTANFTPPTEEFPLL